MKLMYCLSVCRPNPSFDGAFNTPTTRISGDIWPYLFTPTLFLIGDEICLVWNA